MTFQQVSYFCLFARKTTNYKKAAMSNQIRTLVKASIRKSAHIEKIRLRKDLNADALFATMRSGFEKSRITGQVR